MVDALTWLQALHANNISSSKLGLLTVGLFHPFLTPFSIILDFILIPFSSKNEAENETRKDMKMFIFDKMEP
jgi:hypothetical protein